VEAEGNVVRDLGARPLGETRRIEDEQEGPLALGVEDDGQQNSVVLGLAVRAQGSCP
jgi:hypothetical protein